MFETVLEDLLREGHAARFQADGDSMHPTIRAGDTVEILRVPLDSLHPGDVILTRAPRGLTVHRIVRIDGESATTRGDNAAADDPPVALAEVLGRVVAVYRDGVRLSPRGGYSRLRTLMRRAARSIRRSLASG